MRNIDYKIFIASSLHLEEHRRVVGEAINEINSSAAMDCRIQFQEFLYERSQDINQKLEKYDAQEPVNRALRQSMICFFIIDDVIRELTRHEFEVAIQRFGRGQMPQYIMIFHKNGTANEESDEGMTYGWFCTCYNLNNYFYDAFGNSITHRRIYDIPFDTLIEGETSLKQRVFHELQRLLRSDELPFPESVRGTQLGTQMFFADDPLRLDNCPKVYYKRPVDEELERSLRMNNKIVLLTGGSLSGKTRAIMEAMQTVDDGWIYVFRKNANDIDGEKRTIHALAEYVKRANPQKLYMVFDDLGQLAGRSEETRQALDELASAVLSTERHGVIVATSTNADVGVKGFAESMPGVEVLHIDEMKDHDFEMAAQFFFSCGIHIDRANFRYRMMGAFFVNLDNLRAFYQDYLGGEGVPLLMKKELREAHVIVRKLFLKAIKAQSIWRDDYLGDLDMLKSMTKYTFYQEYDIDELTLDKVCENAIGQLCMGGKAGVSRGSGKMLDIQEYVYQYFIGYDGTLKTDVPREVDVVAEKEVINDILRYCASNYYPSDEPLTFQVSRISSRCAYKEENVAWLYSLWSGRTREDETNRYKDVAAMLQKERSRYESLDASRQPELMEHHYSKIIENYIYNCCDFEMAWQAYEASAIQMRTDHLFSAVMRKAVSVEERSRVTQHEDYQRFRDDAYVVRAEAEWAEDFEMAHQVMLRFLNEESAVQVATRLLSPNEIQYDIVQLSRAMNTLFCLVKTEDELETAFDFLRQCYPKLIKDHHVLERIKTKQSSIDCQKLTILDLLARVPSFAHDQSVLRVFGGNLDASLSFIERLKDAVANTLQGQLTTETEIRLLISRIGSQLIRLAAETGSSFGDVKNSLFAALQMPHPRIPGALLLFRNSYTYTAIMKCYDCNIVKAINLFENDLMSHAADRWNPLYINSYTLNVLLEKCLKKDRSFMRRVNTLFNLLEVKRDVFSYYNLLKGSKGDKPNLNECLEIVSEMQENHVEHNIFTLTALMSCVDIDFSTALGFLEIPSDVLCEFFVTLIPEIETVNKHAADLSLYDEAWCEVFRKPCPKANEKETYGRLIHYIEEKHPELLSGGKIYNAILGNKDFIPDTSAAITFIRGRCEAGFFAPDGFTACRLIDKVCAEQGLIRRISLKNVNQLLRDYPEMICEAMMPKRLFIYMTYEEKWPQVFLEESGEVKERELTPIAYLETMRRLHLKVGALTIRAFTRRDMTGLTDDIARRLMHLLVLQQNEFTYDDQDSDAIRERCRGYLDESSIHLKPQSPLFFNKNLTRQFLEKQLDINTAFSLLKWENQSSALTEFHSILSTYIDSFRHKDTRLFDGIMGYYHTYLGRGSGRRPSSYTFSILSKAISCIDDFRRLIAEFKLRKADNPRLTLQPIMLARLSAVVHNIDELAKETKSFMNEGGIVSQAAADIYLYRLTRYFIRTDEANVRPLLNDVFRYIILGGDKQNALYYKQREYLLMPIYENPSNVLAQTLYTIISNNHIITQPLTKEELLKAILEKYGNLIPELMNQLATKAAKHVDLLATWLPPLFYSLAPLSRPNLASNTLEVLAKLLPRFNIAAYEAFVRQLYTIDCRDIEATVPILATCIHRITRDRIHNDILWKSIRRAESQMLVFSELSMLRCGHLLLNQISDQFADWCRHPLQSDIVFKSLIRYDILHADYHDLYDKIHFFVTNLDNPFPVCLMILRLNQSDNRPLDRKVRNLVEDLQSQYVIRLQNGEADFREKMRQPTLWRRARWEPSAELVNALYIPVLDEIAQKGQPLTYQHVDELKYMEQYFVKHLSNSISPSRVSAVLPFLISLPQKWLDAHWIPSMELVQTLIKLYATAITLDSRGAEKAASHLDLIAAEYIRATRNKWDICFIRYKILGECDDERKGVSLPMENFKEVMPEFYLLVLRHIANASDPKEHCEKSLYILKRTEKEYADKLRNGSVIYQPFVLPQLWHKSTFRPSEELILALVSYYIRNVRHSSFIMSCLKRIKHSFQIAQIKEYPTVRLFGQDLGICPKEYSDCYFINTVKLQELLNKNCI